MDSKINETTVKGRKFRRIDKDAKEWIKICGWTPNIMPFKKATPIK